MAAQKLFSDFPSTMGGGVTPAITADITQKSAEDDASTLAGYKARLAAQRAEEEAAYQSKLGYQRGLQLQWEQEDLKRQAHEMMNLDRLRKQAFERVYGPRASSQIEASNNMMLGRQQPFGTRFGAQPVGGDYSGASGWNVGKATVGGRPGVGTSGTPVYGGYWAQPTQGQVQQVVNQQWGAQQGQKAMQNTNPYYNPYAGY
jgi:hypothetical protein